MIRFRYFVFYVSSKPGVGSVEIVINCRLKKISCIREIENFLKEKNEVEWVKILNWKFLGFKFKKKMRRYDRN